MDFSGAEQSDADVKLLIEKISTISEQFSRRQIACINDFHLRIVGIEQLKREIIVIEDHIRTYLQTLETHNDTAWSVNMSDFLEEDKPKVLDNITRLTKMINDIFEN